MPTSKRERRPKKKSRVHLIFFVFLNQSSEFDRSMDEDGYVWRTNTPKKKIAADVRVEQAMHTCVICKQNMYFVCSAFRVSMIIMNNTPKLYGSFYLSWLLIFMMRPMKLRSHHTDGFVGVDDDLSLVHQVHQTTNTIVNSLLRSFVCIWQTNLQPQFSNAFVVWQSEIYNAFVLFSYQNIVVQLFTVCFF